MTVANGATVHHLGGVTSDDAGKAALAAMPTIAAALGELSSQVSRNADATSLLAAAQSATRAELAALSANMRDIGEDVAAIKVAVIHGQVDHAKLAKEAAKGASRRTLALLSAAWLLYYVVALFVKG